MSPSGGWAEKDIEMVAKLRYRIASQTNLKELSGPSSQVSVCRAGSDIYAGARGGSAVDSLVATSDRNKRRRV